MKKRLNEQKVPFVGIVVLNYNGMAHLEECFASLMKLDYRNVGIALVDNASTDGSQDYIRKCFPNVQLIQNAINEHFAQGMNRGMKYWLEKGADYIALLNNDVEVERDWLAELIKMVQTDQRIGAVASRMMYYTNRKIINGIGVDFNMMAYAWDRYQGETFKKSMGHSEDVFSFCAGAVLLNVAALRETGLFDPWHMFYLEDVDLSFRLHARGWRIVTAPSAVVYHKFSASTKQGSPFKDYFILRNRLKMILYYFPLREVWPRIISRIIRKELGTARRWLRRREWHRALLQLKPFIDCILRLPSAIIFRKVNPPQYSVIKMLAHGLEPDILPYFNWDYERADRGKISQYRIIMGVSDNLLGDGWYPLELSSPQCRWTCNETDCLLRTQRDVRSILQLHVRQPIKNAPTQNLKVYMEDEQIGDALIEAGDWHTHHFSCTPRKSVEKFTFKLAYQIHVPMGRRCIDAGVQFNEVSILTEDSPFLRRMERQ
ncbi:MAG: glycosyltransferase family 2 protein [Candidatus Aureabacteria bacterium]|nr:glycosyltransferase family 2 protein [Candidatus Auribacterota bacterium]